MQYKVRRVKTPEGRERYGQEIGEIIVPDAITGPQLAGLLKRYVIRKGLWAPDRDGGYYQGDYLLAARMKEHVCKNIAERMSDIPLEDMAAAVDPHNPNLYKSIIDGTDPNTGIRPDEPLLLEWDDEDHCLYLVGYDDENPESFNNDRYINGQSKGWPEAGTEEAKQLARYALVSQLIKKWAQTSNDSDAVALALQDTAKSLFRLRNTAPWELNTQYLDAGDIAYMERRREDGEKVFRRFLQAQYEETQALFEELGIERITVYRGIKNNTDRAGRDLKSRQSMMRPLSACTTSPRIAYQFATEHHAHRPGAIYEVVVPVSKVLSTWVTGFGCTSEEEVVILGGANTATAINPDTYPFKFYDPLGSNAPDGERVIPNVRVRLRRKSAQEPDTINFDDSDLNADWLRTISWDLPRNPRYYIREYGDDLAKWFQHIMELPAGMAMPEDLRIALLEAIGTNGIETKARHVRDADFWGAPVGTPLPLPKPKAKVRVSAMPKPVWKHPAANVEIRRTRQRDLKKWEEQTPSEYLRNLYSDTFQPPYYVFAKDDDGNIVGVGSLILDRQSHMAIVNGLHTDPDVRGQGHGTYMMEAVAQYVRSLPNGDKYDLSVQGMIATAESYYEQIGGQPVNPDSPDEVDRQPDHWSPDGVAKLASGRYSQPKTTITKQTGEPMGVVATSEFTGAERAIYRRAMNVRKRIMDAITKRTAKMSDEDKQRALDNVREVRQRGKVMVAAPKDAALKLLAEDRIKTQFETDTSPTVVAKQTRAVYETAVLDIHPGVDPAKRPVYGYMSVDKPTQRGVGRYGEIRFELKPTVHDRTSITFGDSLGHSVMPIELTGDDESNVYGAISQMAPRYDLDTYQDRKFIEAQIRGGVHVSDIASVYIPDTDDYNAVADKAAELGIEVNHYQYKPQPLVVRAIRTAEVRFRSSLARNIRKLGGESKEYKVRHVRDADYWGMPVGTPITPGMKPQQLTIPRVGRSRPIPGINKRDLRPKIDAYVEQQYGITEDDYNVSGQVKQAITERILAFMKDVPTADLVEASLFNNPQSPTRALRLDLLDPNNKAWEHTGSGYGLYERRHDSILGPVGPRPGDVLMFSQGDLYIWSPDHQPRPHDPLYDVPPAKYAKVGTPEAEQLLRESAVTDLVAVWAMSSNDTNPISLALQECAKDLFNLEGTRNWGSDPERRHDNDRFRRVYNKFLEAQYMATQHMLASIGVSSVRAYRGMKTDRASDAGVNREDVVLKTRPLSSWSTNWDIANGFAGSYGAIYEADIPASRILSFPVTGIGCYSEEELVVLGGTDRRQKFRHRVYMSKADAPVVDLDCDDEHADWLRGMAWDMPTDPYYFIGRFGDNLQDWYDHIMSLPAGKAMPSTLRTALLEQFVGQTRTARIRVRAKKTTD